MFRNKTASQKNFAISPRGDIQRSVLPMKQTRKQAFNASELIPIMLEEVLPGDTWQHTEAIAARLATPIAPVIDDLHLETFYFFIPNRILWEGWEDFITGADLITQMPTVEPYNGTNSTLLLGGVLDHMGLLPQTYTTSAFNVNILPVLGYFTTYNEWFRDQNLQEPFIWPTAAAINTRDFTQNGTAWDQKCVRANKPHDYFTSSLPFAQKGPSVSLPLGTTAPVIPITAGTSFPAFQQDGGGANRALATLAGTAGAAYVDTGSPYFPINGAAQRLIWQASGLQADLSTATAATLNALRIAATTQQLLEKDARGGSRYTEQLLIHFGAKSPDYRLQRPEYLGGSRLPITVNPIAQTAAYDAAPDDEASAIGNLGAEMHANGNNRTFTYASTEHGYILGLAVARATPTYQQGTRKHWRRRTRLDYAFPVFANLGEQAVATQEIYQPANNAPSVATWGYQERYAEMRYTPNEITGVLRSTAPQPLDWWHYSEEFGTEPGLNPAFITDKTQETLARSLFSSPSAQWSSQFVMDISHVSRVARMLPAYGVPGLTRF
ncbi:MAG: major capsid protein [Microvirus sp.]|nr:MAG: major capsid protein [Microvirus sp.]